MPYQFQLMLTIDVELNRISVEVKWKSLGLVQDLN